MSEDDNKISIIRKSKRCKKFKRCVRRSKTRSTNGGTPLKTNSVQRNISLNAISFNASHTFTSILTFSQSSIYGNLYSPFKWC